MNLLCTFAMLVMVTQTPVPVPRQTTDGTTARRANANAQGGKHDPQPIPAMSSVQNLATGEDKNTRTQQPQQDQPHAVVIRELPPVSVTKDWADWGVWVFSFLLVIVGGLQVWLMRSTLVAIARQSKIANDMLVATFRPKLIVRSVNIIKGTVIPVIGRPGKPWYLSYTLTNIGGVRATVVLQVVQVALIENKVLPASPPHDERARDETPFLLLPGAHKECKLMIPENIVFLLRELGQSIYPTEVDNMCLMGYLRFRDDIGTVRSMGFCRFRDFRNKRFVPVDDADYEYAD